MEHLLCVSYNWKLLLMGECLLWTCDFESGCLVNVWWYHILYIFIFCIPSIKVGFFSSCSYVIVSEMFFHFLLDLYGWSSSVAQLLIDGTPIVFLCRICMLFFFFFSERVTNVDLLGFCWAAVSYFQNGALFAPTSFSYC